MMKIKFTSCLKAIILSKPSLSPFVFFSPYEM